MKENKHCLERAASALWFLDHFLLSHECSGTTQRSGKGVLGLSLLPLL